LVNKLLWKGSIKLFKEAIKIPYPNEHSCRLKSPDLFENNSFRRIAQGKLSIIIGKLKGQTTTTTQAYRYPVSKWDADDAEKHCKEHKGSFHKAG